MSRKRIFLIISIFSLFCISLNAQITERVIESSPEPYDLDDGHGHDSSVMTLSEIDKLIKDTDYDRALAELHKYIETHPDNFDNAQARISKIMNARKKYSDLALELVKVIMEDPSNSEKIYKLTHTMETLEKHPTDKQLEFIRETRIAAEFSYFRAEFARIQKETEELIDKGEYLAAAQKAHEGYYLYQETFYETWNQPEIINPVNNALSDIDAMIAQYADIQKKLNDCVNDFILAVNSERQEDIRKTYQAVDTNFNQLASIRNNIYLSGETFKNVFQVTVSKYGAEDTDGSFLPFAQRFTLGLSNNEKTGVIGAIDSEWNMLCDKMKNAAWGKIDKYVSEIEKTVPDKLFYDAKYKFSLRSDLLPVLRRYADLSLQVNTLYDKLTPTIHEAENHYYAVAADYSYELLSHINSLFANKSSYEEKIIAITNFKQPENPASAEMANSDYVERFIAALSEIDLNDINNTAIDLENAEWAKEYIALDTTKKREPLENKYTGFVSEMKESSSKVILDGYEVICEYSKLAANGFVEMTKADYENAMMNFDGFQRAILERYPDRALQLANDVQKQIDKQIDIIDRHITYTEHNENKPLAQQTVSSLNEDKKTLLNYRIKTNELIAMSNSQLKKAEIAKNEADLRYNQVETALKRNDFDTARTRLQDSRTKYNESLEIAFSPELQASSDEKLQAIGERINQLENEIIVRDVRELKTRAKNEYYAGNFEQAESLLTQAKTRWAITNVEEDAEITNLLAVVNTALSMKVGRVLLPSAALFPEMSQILSIAMQYYTEGTVLLERGQRAEGEEILTQALQKLQELQLVYPLNQEASLLTLRIQKILNPKEFDLMFDRKIAEARNNYRVKDTQKQAYTDLLDLYEINPKYPGLKDLIYNVEIEIGIRQKPVDNTAKNRSSALTLEAQEIMNNAGRDEAKLRQALSKLDEAIALNAGNNDAIRLKDQIQTSIGGKAAVVLSSEDEIKYQQAIQEMQKNNLITANALVEQLLQKQSNRNSAKILELQKKIKALL